MTAVHVAFTVAGCVLEVGGIGVVVAEAIQIRREEFGVVGPIRQAWRWVRRHVLRRRPQTVYVQAFDSAAVSDAALAVEVRRAPIDDPVEALKRRVDDVERVLKATEGRLAAHESSTTERIEAVAVRVESRVGAVEDRRRRDLKATVRNNIVGAALFFLGAVFSMLANLT